MTPSQGTEHEDPTVKARNTETVSKAMMKNALSEWVEPKRPRSISLSRSCARISTAVWTSQVEGSATGTVTPGKFEVTPTSPPSGVYRLALSRFFLQ